ncbi:sulfurtransferase [Lihuaxuella thermophila]|uniref:Thiosulfate/3-mercaptopyruvate sulfurtransferase n=1 Tax=Lihuaxuella thermophila TaxID=1173111 RepID=A0A1H8AP50_9BACL|nr:sulfurtransferase [Lihuaxuella thermophila]SEM72522.1 thiosulfate/3-mercaptopyruvate sulfurtransferase [Lihuaxuella thermophila]
MNRIVSMDWVANHLDQPGLVLVDCRFTLGQPDAGKKAYLHSHLPGAFYLDLEKDLSGPVREHGGRHPLPDIQILAGKLGKIGIDENVHVVAYDDQGGAMASRLWWLLTYLGHEQVSVMNGTFSRWREQGYPVTAELPSAEPRTFIPRTQPRMMADMNEVKQKLHQKETLLLDSREEKRYLGEEEPIDPVAGHIPGAKHSFWKDVHNEQGGWKTPEELRQLFGKFPPANEIIVYCGSGVTATPNVLALCEAGYRNVKLYPGSWSDWISYRENPIARGKEE